MHVISLVFQAMINMGLAVNLLPVTGQPLPLISMGGTSIWFTSLAIGIILSVSKELDTKENTEAADDEEEVEVEEAEEEAEWDELELEEELELDELELEEEVNEDESEKVETSDEVEELAEEFEEAEEETEVDELELDEEELESQIQSAVEELSEEDLESEVDGNILSVVASKPDKPGLESAIREYISYDVVFRVGLRRDICDTVKEFYDKSPFEINPDSDLRKERQLEAEVEIIEDSGDFVIKEED